MMADLPVMGKAGPHADTRSVHLMARVIGILYNEYKLTV